jgi:hypothetical protein
MAPDTVNAFDVTQPLPPVGPDFDATFEPLPPPPSSYQLKKLINHAKNGEYTYEDWNGNHVAMSPSLVAELEQTLQDRSPVTRAKNYAAEKANQLNQAVTDWGDRSVAPKAEWLREARVGLAIGAGALALRSTMRVEQTRVQARESLNMAGKGLHKLVRRNRGNTAPADQDAAFRPPAGAVASLELLPSPPPAPPTNEAIRSQGVAHGEVVPEPPQFNERLKRASFKVDPSSRQRMAPRRNSRRRPILADRPSTDSRALRRR